MEILKFGPYIEEPYRLGPKIDFWPVRPHTIDEMLNAVLFFIVGVEIIFISAVPWSMHLVTGHEHRDLVGPAKEEQISKFIGTPHDGLRVCGVWVGMLLPHSQKCENVRI